MDIFISWSGEKSLAVAELLRTWLPDVIQRVVPFVSSTDIGAGRRWSQEIADRLEATNFGIVCVTAENHGSPWLNFEAGALAKAIDISRVVPLLVDVEPSEIDGPLAQFQAVALNQEGLTRVVETINTLISEPLTPDRLKRAVERSWDHLDAELEDVRKRPAGKKIEARSETDLLAEILVRVRELSNQPAGMSSATPQADVTLARLTAVRDIIKRHDPGATVNSAPKIGVSAGLTGRASATQIKWELQNAALDDVPVRLYRA